MPELNTKTSVVDYLKSTGQNSDFNSRASLAVSKGIVKSASEYVGSAQQNTSLLSSLRGGSGSNPSPSASGGAESGGRNNDAFSMINDGQDRDFEVAESADEPATRGKTPSVADFYSSLSETISQALGDRPETYNSVDRFQELQEKYKVEDLESDMNALKDEQRAIEAVQRERTAAAREKRVAQGVIAGRVSTIERQEAERLDANLRQQAYISDQLNTKYNTINTIMSLEQQDYTNAVQSYNDRFGQTFDTLTMARGLRSDQLSEDEREETKAQANLQIMYNSITSGAADYASLDAATRATITKLEVQSGMPVGFVEALAAKAGDAEIISSASREDNGESYTDIVLRNADGSFTVETLYRGRSLNESSGGGNDGPDGVDAFEFSNSAVGKLLSTGMSRQDINNLQNDIDQYGAEVAMEGLEDVQRRVLRDVLTGNDDVETATADAQFNDDQNKKIAIALVKQLEVDGAKQKIETGELKISGKTYKLSQEDINALLKKVDEEYPNGRTTAQRILPWGK